MGRQRIVRSLDGALHFNMKSFLHGFVVNKVCQFYCNSLKMAGSFMSIAVGDIYRNSP